jgi:hypothetical protein
VILKSIATGGDMKSIFMGLNDMNTMVPLLKKYYYTDFND